MIQIEMENGGIIRIELDYSAAPVTAANFEKLVREGFYNGLIFHRVIPGFMIQGGDPTATGCGGQSVWGKPFEDECDPNVAFDRPGLLAMANAGPGTNGSQFFITTVPTPWLHMHHTIFGEVAEGMDAVEKIENSPTGYMDKPVEAQKINSVTVE